MEERWPASLQCKTLLNQLKKGLVDAFLQGKQPSAVETEYTGEQRVLDVIFRKNGSFFLATEEPLDPLSDVEALFLDASFNLPSQVSSTIDPWSDGFDLSIDQIMDFNNFDDFLGSFIEGPTGGANFPFFPVASDNPPAREQWAIARSAETQSLIDTCDQILGNLPVCKFCRNRRIKCSRTLPACHNCVDFGIECEYMEPATGHWLHGK